MSSYHEAKATLFGSNPGFVENFDEIKQELPIS